MKKIAFLLICIFLSFEITAQSFIGAWESYRTSAQGDTLKSILIFSDRYQVITTYNANSGEFISTNGGSWKLDGDTMTEKVEFNSTNPENVGSEISFQVSITDSIVEIVGTDIKMKRIDDGSPGALNGAWLMSGRTIDGETEFRNSDTARKTMKILSGSRFQWIAYDTETKKFIATGGGTYTTQDGIYTENIEFFSRDNSKVRLQLKFEYGMIDDNWHHSGFSTKGDPIDEIWSKRK